MDAVNTGRLVSNTDTQGIFGCRGIGISFGGRPVLKNVDLHVENHEVVGLVGPNGAGKTSLFEVLCGRYKPTSGQVFLKGEELTSISVHGRARRGLARTYQSPVVPSAMTVAEVLRAARFSHKPYLTRFDAEWGLPSCAFSYQLGHLGRGA